MRYIISIFASCLLYVSDSPAAATTCRNNWTEISQATSGVVLATRIEDFQVGQPAPPDFLAKIGPLLCANGTEELRVRSVPLAEPDKQAQRTIHFEEFIRGRKVFRSSVDIRLNVETNEVAMIDATFLPDRDMDPVARLTVEQAKAKAVTGLSQALSEKLGPKERQFTFRDKPAQLMYDIEQSGSAPTRGVLVWELSAANVATNERYEVHVNAATGTIVRMWAWAN